MQTTIPIDGMKTFLTGDGEQLINARPDIAAQIQDAVEQESNFLDIHRPFGFEPVGVGRWSRVDGFPDEPELCIKVSSRYIPSAAWKYNMPVRPLDLLLQTRFMDRLRTQTIKTQEHTNHNVFVPKQYFAARNPKTGFNVAIMERLHNKQGIDRARADFSVAERQAIINRINMAVGGTILQVGINDVIHGSKINRGNVLFDQNADDIETTPLYLIGLPNGRALRVKTALFLNKMLHI